MTTPFSRLLEKYEKRFIEIEKRIGVPIRHEAPSVRMRETSVPAVIATQCAASAEPVRASSAALNERIAAQQEEITILRNQLREKNDALAATEESVRLRQAELGRRDEERESLAAALSERTAAVHAADEKNRSLLNDIRFLKAEIAFHANRADEDFAQKAGCDELLKSKEDEIARLFERLADTENERDEMNARLKILQLRSRSLRSEYSLRRRKSRRPFARLIRWLCRPVAVIDTGKTPS